MSEQKSPEEIRYERMATSFFPVLVSGSSFGGISKIEFFAGMALMGLMDAECLLDVDVAAQKSVAYAEAVLVALGK